MPFTFAHPAAILPLRRSRFLQTVPLIIGSMVPDAPYFFPWRVAKYFFETHTLSASFLVDVPLGMAFLVATLLLKEPLTILLPVRARWTCLRSIERFYARPLHWPIALFSILIGAWTHIAWDSVTHQTGWTAERVAALSAPVSIFGWDTETSHLLQYLSSVFGLVVLALWFRSLLKRVPATVTTDQSRPPAQWWLLGLIAFASVLIGISRAWPAWQLGSSSYYRLAYLLLTRTIGWFVALYLTAGIIVLLSRRRRPVLRPESP
ncbi:MAG: hypothetical protein QOI59_2259 [Gammaproteobacteria bacterium]|jgi:uncharacterized membrane protein YfcA|nr:hypothetical protein [Gammaproteobacteria bacterium]